MQWSTRTLAEMVVEQGIVESIHYSTVHHILKSIDLQPHRNKYWKTTRVDEQFKHRAEQILWCYEHVERLVADGYLVICVDEKPNIQALERLCPTRPAAPGLVRRTEFEYIRHGTVNMLFYLYVHCGKMVGHCIPKNDAEHYIESLEYLRHAHRDAKGVYLIQDNGPSHTAELTQEYFSQDQDWWRPRYTPAHGSWLNEAELLIGAFTTRYIRGGSWSTNQALIDHLDKSWPEYNRRYAQPFEWTWSRPKMRKWYEDHVCLN